MRTSLLFAAFEADRCHPLGSTIGSAADYAAIAVLLALALHSCARGPSPWVAVPWGRVAGLRERPGRLRRPGGYLITPEAITPGPWLLSRNTSQQRSRRSFALMPLGANASPRITPANQNYGDANVSHIHYFGEPVYTYSRKLCIRDGFVRTDHRPY
jgi:hypothetical protein